MPLLTVFTSPKPFTQPHINLIQRNAILAALALEPEVEFLLIGDEAGMAEAAAEYGVRHIAQVERTAYGTPRLDAIFDLARQHSQSPYLAYINGDILLLPDLLDALRTAAQTAQRFLLVSQRWDAPVTNPLSTSAEGWQDALKADLRQRGTLSGPTAIDLFVFPRDLYTDMPPFALGRSGWDNWMIYHARSQGWPCIDLSAAITLGHQNHDYNHLPNGQPHYRLPESKENVRLAGGRRMILDIRDATHEMRVGQVQRARLSWRKFWREVELFPLLKLHSMALANLAFAILHPGRALYEARPTLAKVKRCLLGRA